MVRRRRTAAVLCRFAVVLFDLIPRTRHSTSDQLRTDLIGLSPPPGTPPAALSLRKYHYHRSSVIALPESNSGIHPTSKAPREGDLLWAVACQFLDLTAATYLLKVYSFFNDQEGRFFVPSLIIIFEAFSEVVLRRPGEIFLSFCLQPQYCNLPHL